MMELLSNNCLSHVRMLLLKKGLLIVNVVSTNNGRYHFIKTKKLGDGFSEWYLIKYTEKPYLSAEGGFSDSLNVETLKDINSRKHNGLNINKVLTVYKNGEVWATDYLNYLLYGFIKEREYDKDSYILNWNKKDINNNNLWEVWK